MTKYPLIAQKEHRKPNVRSEYDAGCSSRHTLMQVGVNCRARTTRKFLYAGFFPKLDTPRSFLAVESPAWFRLM